MNKRSFDTIEYEQYERPATEPWTDEQLANYHLIEADLNAQIVEVTMSIREEFPELLRFVDEVPVTVPNKQHPSITLTNLTGYFGSLCWMLSKYRRDHQIT